MNYAIILAAGAGQRMRNAGLPKQFLNLFGKPIVVYTLEKFAQCEKVDKIVIVCRQGYLDLMNQLIAQYSIQKVEGIVVGADTRLDSILKGVESVKKMSLSDRDIVIIHDGVRPMITQAVIEENIRVAGEYGCAMTVHAVNETVVVTHTDKATKEGFQKRDDTYTVTAPQSFRMDILKRIDFSERDLEKDGMPLLDTAMVYAADGGKACLVKETNMNIKITTPEDFYYLKAMLELEENKHIFGL